MKRDEDPGSGLGMNPEDALRWQHSYEQPGFVGTYEFELTFEALGQRVSRQARVNYRYTPPWEYWDLCEKGLFTGWESWQISMSVRTAPDEDQEPAIKTDQSEEDNADDPSPPEWVSCDLARVHILPRVWWDRLYGRIEEKCKAEDLRRRRSKGM